MLYVEAETQSEPCVKPDTPSLYVGTVSRASQPAGHEGVAAGSERDRQVLCS